MSEGLGRAQRALAMAAVGAGLALAVGAAPAHAALAGDLDTTFGTGGLLMPRIDPASAGESALAVAVQPDGKIVSGGDSFDAASGVSRFAVSRYNADGSADKSFGTGGTALAPLGDANDGVQAMVLQPDGKIVVAGGTGVNGATDFGVARFTPEGKLDDTFAGDGVQVTPFGSGSSTATGVALGRNGTIVVVGTSGTGAGSQYAIARYKANGELDDTFRNGTVSVSFGNGSVADASGVAVQPNGAIVVVGTVSVFGSTSSTSVILRYTEGGQPDTSFSVDSTQTVEPPDAVAGQASSVTLAPDGKIVVGGTTFDSAGTGRFTVARFEADSGDLDTSFSDDGIQVTPIARFDSMSSVAAQADGKIVAAGVSKAEGARTALTLVRYGADGTLDSGFATGGVRRTSLTGEDPDGQSVAVQRDGNIVVGGYVDAAGRRILLARYRGADGPPSPPPAAAPPPPPAAPVARDTLAPAITGSRLSPNRFAVDGRARASARAPRGTKLALRLSEPATVIFVTEQRVGRRWRKVRIFGQRLPAGRSTIDYGGKIKPRGRQRALRPGRYRLRMRPSDRAGNRGKLTTLRFTIVRR